MSLPLVSFELYNNYLLVIGHGVRDSNASMIEATVATYQKILETQSQFLLVDYRKVEIDLDHVQAFNLIKTYESKMPQLHQVTAACVFNDTSKEFALYWQSIGRKRGFDIFIFETLEDAERWLKEKMSTEENKKAQ
jgi:hypothetical protein